MNSTVLTQILDNIRKPTKIIRTRTSKKSYELPSLELLNSNKDKSSGCAMDVCVLEDKLAEFGFKGTVEHVSVGPLITRYEVRMGKGVRISQVKSVADDLAIALQSSQIRIQAPIPGTSLVGIEVANEKFSTVGFQEVIKAVVESKATLPIGIGVDITGKPKVVDLAKMPHLLIAGQTGSGKSVGLNGIILSLLYTKTPNECKLVLVDPKRVEMASYEGLPNLFCPVVTDSAEVLNTLERMVTIMETRYEGFKQVGVRNIESYYDYLERREDCSPEEVARYKAAVPYLVIVIDEMADLILTATKEMEKVIVRLAQLGRAAGIHLILATQKPIVKVITGLIKSNLPSRIAYQVTSGIDSRVILDNNGAEKLLGRGDLLMQYPGVSEPERFHGAWVSDGEIQAVCDDLR
jgi:S-DNA-T family DNA segregation ATPase FtsK/SpoIIIE